MAFELEVLVVGAGPAGVQLGYFLEKDNVLCNKYAVLEKNKIGHFFSWAPRRRELISFNKITSLWEADEGARDRELRWDWNSLITHDQSNRFSEINQDLLPPAAELVKYLKYFVAKSNIKVYENTGVVGVEKLSGGGFAVTDTTGKVWATRTVVVASGWGKPNIPKNMPGVELAELYQNAPTDPKAYFNQRVLIIGKGNSSFEISDLALRGQASMVHIASPNHTRLAWQSGASGHVRTMNSLIIDMYQLKTLNTVWSAGITSIRKEGGAFAVTFSALQVDDVDVSAGITSNSEEFFYDRIVLAAAFMADFSFLKDDVQPEMTPCEKLPLITPNFESVNVAGLFFAGTVAQEHDRFIPGFDNDAQLGKPSSGFIHGFRWNIRNLYRTLCEQVLVGKGRALELSRPWPKEVFAADAGILAAEVCKRSSLCAGLWNMPAYLTDIIVIKGGLAIWEQERTMKQVTAAGNKWELESCYFTLSFEYTWGSWKWSDNILVQEKRHAQASNAEKERFIHPIIRMWSFGNVVGTHHLLTDILGTFDAALDPKKAFRGSAFGSDIVNLLKKTHYEPMRIFFEKHIVSLEAAGIPQKALLFPAAVSKL